ncbi:hypothetical protein BKA80DRAFT_259122 [Phyllosticta citrichinensis]
MLARMEAGLLVAKVAFEEVWGVGVAGALESGCICPLVRVAGAIEMLEVAFAVDDAQDGCSSDMARANANCTSGDRGLESQRAHEYERC